MRLNRFIARAGVCSRRKADELIRRGQVRVNGAVADTLGAMVQPGDEVRVGGKLITPRPYVYVLLNKPHDAITTVRDPRGRRTVMDLVELPEGEGEGLFPVGRLDRDTSGVLLLTNDGDLAHRLMHPSYEIEKLYRVETEQPVKPHEIEALRSGVELEDGPAAADEVGFVALPDQTVVGLRIHEGRNRQVRRMFEHLGHRVKSLERVAYAGLTTKDVRSGKWRKLRPKEVARLRRAVGLK